MVLSWVYNLLVRILFRVRVRDVDCAFKIFRREVLEKIDIETTNFFVDTELVAKARKWNFRIVEKGVRHYPRMAGETKIEPSDIPRTLRVVLTMLAADPPPHPAPGRGRREGALRGPGRRRGACSRARRLPGPRGVAPAAGRRPPAADRRGGPSGYPGG